MLSYIKGTMTYGLKFFDLYGFSDADWLGDTDNRRPTSGYALILQPAGAARSKAPLPNPLQRQNM